MAGQRQVKRRDFLATAGALVSAPCIIPSGVLAAAGRPGANDRITLGHIGVGGMGNGHLGRGLNFRKLGLTETVAVCDVDQNRLAAAVKRCGDAGARVTPYADYRALLDREDIDAVIIATPDHWHGVQTVHACISGKHVYVEKPSSVTIEEGQAMVEAARANDCMVQVGAQGRSGLPAYYTCRAVRNGMIGKVNKVDCWHYANPVDQNPVADSDPPPELDWDMWLGPLRWRPYNSGISTAHFDGC